MFIFTEEGKGVMVYKNSVARCSLHKIGTEIFLFDASLAI
jgi:hypothetical protein